MLFVHTQDIGDLSPQAFDIIAVALLSELTEASGRQSVPLTSPEHWRKYEQLPPAAARSDAGNSGAVSGSPRWILSVSSSKYHTRLLRNMPRRWGPVAEWNKYGAPSERARRTYLLTVCLTFYIKSADKSTFQPFCKHKHHASGWPLSKPGRVRLPLRGGIRRPVWCVRTCSVPPNPG